MRPKRAECGRGCLDWRRSKKALILTSCTMSSSNYCYIAKNDVNRQANKTKGMFQQLKNSQGIDNHPQTPGERRTNTFASIWVHDAPCHSGPNQASVEKRICQVYATVVQRMISIRMCPTACQVPIWKMCALMSPIVLLIKMMKKKSEVED